MKFSLAAVEKTIASVFHFGSTAESDIKVAVATVQSTPLLSGLADELHTKVVALAKAETGIDLDTALAFAEKIFDESVTVFSKVPTLLVPATGASAADAALVATTNAQSLSAVASEAVAAVAPVAEKEIEKVLPAGDAAVAAALMPAAVSEVESVVGTEAAKLAGKI